MLGIDKIVAKKEELGLSDDEAAAVVKNFNNFINFNEKQDEFYDYIIDEIWQDGKKTKKN